MLTDEQQQRLIKYFYDGGNFVLMNFVKMRNVFPDIDMKDLLDWYENQEIVQIMRTGPLVSEKERTGEAFKPIISWYPFQRFYLDTMFLKEYDLVIVVGLDLYSRYAFSRVFHGNQAQGIKSSQALKAMLGFLDEIKDLGYTLKKYGSVCVDDGGEFKGNFKEHLKQKGIEQVVSRSGDFRKNRNIERFNKTLRSMLEKYANVYDKKIDQNVITKLIDGYNNAVHSSLDGLTPVEALKDMVKSHLLFRHYVDLKNANKDKPDEELKVGDYVRIYVRGDSPFKKIKKNWSKGLHQIEKVDNKMYKIDGVKKWVRLEHLQVIDKELFDKYNYNVEGAVEKDKDELKKKKKVRINKDIADVLAQPVLEGKRQRKIGEFFKK